MPVLAIITNDLQRRVYEHKHKLIEGFTKKYNVTRLVYFEETRDVNAAIYREKEIKGWRRSKKLDLIKSINPKWEDLAADLFDYDNLKSYYSITINPYRSHVI